MKPKRLVRRRYRSVAALRWSAEAAAILLAGGRGVITAEAARGRGAGGSRNTRGCHHRVPQGAVAHENGNSELGVCRPHQPGDRTGSRGRRVGRRHKLHLKRRPPGSSKPHVHERCRCRARDPLGTRGRQRSRVVPSSESISPRNSTSGSSRSGATVRSKYSRSTASILAAILSGSPTRRATSMAMSGCFSGDSRPRNARYPLS